MKKTGLIAAVCVMAAAASVGSVEPMQETSSATAGERAHASIATLHAAIPSTAESGNVFEYSAALTMPVPQKITVAQHQEAGQVFEYY